MMICLFCTTECMYCFKKDGWMDEGKKKKGKEGRYTTTLYLYLILKKRGDW